MLMILLCFTLLRIIAAIIKQMLHWQYIYLRQNSWFLVCQASRERFVIPLVMCGSGLWEARVGKGPPGILVFYSVCASCSPCDFRHPPVIIGCAWQYPDPDTVTMGRGKLGGQEPGSNGFQDNNMVRDYYFCEINHQTNSMFWLHPSFVNKISVVSIYNQ